MKTYEIYSPAGRLLAGGFFAMCLEGAARHFRPRVTAGRNMHPYRLQAVGETTLCQYGTNEKGREELLFIVEQAE